MAEKNYEELLDKIEDLETSLRVKDQMATLYETVNKVEIHNKVQDNRITFVERDVSVLAKGQEELKECTKQLHNKIDAVEQKQGVFQVTLDSTYSKISDFIDTHKTDARDAVRWMNKLTWCIVLVGLSLVGIVSGYIAWQNSVIVRTSEDKFELMKNYYEGNKIK